MKQLSRIVLMLIIIISLLVGMFPILANSTIYHILYALLFGMTFIYIIMKIYNRNFKYNLILILILIFILLGIFYRNEKRTIYALSFVCILFSCYVFEVSELNAKFINNVSLLLSFAIVPTIIFNGIFNSNIEGGTSFSGRLNPFMYFPYLLIAMINNKKNKAIEIALKIIFILTFVDIIWSGSRVALLSMLFIIVMYILICLNNKNIIFTKTIKKMLKILLIVIIVLQIIIPQIYIWLYKNYENELNTWTYNLTGKYFFSGRQRVWSRIDETIQGNETWGTGDVDYKEQLQSPHNEFMNLYYCWGIFVSLLTFIYFYIIGKRCITNASNKMDLIIILGFLANIICTMFETYLYTAHFFIFNNLLVAYLLNKNKLEKGEKEYE